MAISRYLQNAAFSLVLSSVSIFAGEPASTTPATAAAKSPPNPSEDKVIGNFHSLGEIGGRSNIYRCANPIGPVTERLKGQPPSDADRREAKERMQHLYQLGVRTVVSLQNQQAPTESVKNAEYDEVLMEKAAAAEVGIAFIPYSLSNRGKNSLQYQSSADVTKVVEAIGNDVVKHSETGGVAFHCKSGKDRTGLVAGYLRVKYQHWTVEDALAEMRQNGHVWQKFLKPGAEYSWHEEHLRAIAAQVAPEK
ncbi:MAG TPA: tyrosine-protein phosphatase [Chthoniobacteraceae bacterium]|nr:tyrosine-protein phosphatase [Chthoniobacteraceae bacterium]